ncbi:purine-cytosine permease family protein [Nocardioides sp. GXZ039]|uniref:purine-cytosine permease family protein n=1 Tax=Nocardioides sp. GXZ039 TaxID=3136018 RepID=UPI0030F39030
MDDVAAEASFPIHSSERTWGPLAVFGNTASAAIATWCFITGGFVAYYVDAGPGSIAIIAGTLIGVFISLLAALPPATRYGVEAVRSTRPTLGVRGSWLTLALVLVILVGWNSVLTIFLGRSGAETLHALGVVDSPDGKALVVAIGLLSCAAVIGLLWKGPSTLRLAGPAIAITVMALALVMMVFLLAEFGWDRIFSAPALAPLPDRSTNYMIVIELGIAGAVAWWPYIGSLTRHSRSTRTAVAPSILGLGLLMGIVLSIGLFAAVVVPASAGNPTLFMIEAGGPALGVVALGFMVLANVGTTMVGVYACALALKQVRGIDRAISWRTASLVSILPVVVVLVLFADPFMDHYGTFLAFAGVTLGPVCGLQIVDYFILRRQRLSIHGLYDDDNPTYRYVGGFNPAGFVALAAGIATYLLMLDPVNFVPGTQAFSWLSATAPAAVASGLVYYVIMRAAPGLLRPSLATTASPGTPAPARATDPDPDSGPRVASPTS